MSGITWLYLVPIIVSGAFGAVLIRSRRRSDVSKTSLRCSDCETPMSMRAVAVGKWRSKKREWECPHCGARIDKSAKSGEREIERMPHSFNQK
jgi:DNA-directed RNA polymerase subunit RPC12/RpoP